MAIITGSSTTGTVTPSSASATARMIAGENSIPILTAATSRSSSTAAIWAETTAAGTSCTAVTACVFCAVIAVIALLP